jgi:hypothetical protein
MLKDKTHMTPTLAKVLASQGHLEEAAAGYGYLLAQTPGHVGLQEALNDVQVQLNKRREKGDTLAALFEEWISLALTYNRLRRCKNFRRKDG